MSYAPKVPGWKILFWRFLYRAYKSNKGASHFLKHHITPLGYMLGVGLLLALLLRLSSSGNAIFGIVAALAAMLLCSFITVWFRRANVEVKRILPDVASVDHELHYSIELKNKSKFSLKAVFIREMEHRRVPPVDVFVHSVEPGEEMRNAFDRLFVVYRWSWLTGSRKTFETSDSEFFHARGGEKISVPITVIPKRRGLMHFRDMRLMMPDSFSLFQRCKKVGDHENTVLVIPKRYKISHLELPGSAKNHAGGESHSNQVGQSSEFVGLRDYRCGDPIKHVDWKAWAKTGEPIVREYEDVFYPRHGLLLDTGVHPTLHDEFEEAVSVAASFASCIDTNEGILDLVLMQQNTEVLTVGKGIERLDRMMEVLAVADIEPSPHWEDLISRVLEVAPEYSSCIMVLADWSEERAQLLSKTSALGVELVCLLVTSNPELTRKKLAEFPPVKNVHLLEIGKMQQCLNRALSAV